MRLPQPATPAGRAGLAALLADPGSALVGLDFDGTLAPIVADPEQARAHPRAAGVLARLAGQVGRVAVVTGRPAEVAVDLGALSDVGNLVVLGHYGLERWEGGRTEAPADDPGVELVRRRLPSLLAELGAPPGTLVEDKGRSVAVHVRRTDDPASALALVETPLRALAEEAGLAIEPGRLVLELRPRGMDKGAALLDLAAETIASVVVFAGDDLGDLAAYDAVDRLRVEGTPGVLVCSGSVEVRALSDRADLVVDGPDGVVALLGALADVLERQPADFDVAHPGRDN